MTPPTMTRKIGPHLNVFPIGLGCMGMSFAYGGQDEQDAIRTLHRAVELGVTLFDTAEVYGPYVNETLLGKALAGKRDKVVIATKFGFKLPPDPSGLPGTDGSPANVKRVAEASLKRLNVEVIDLFYQHRVDPAVPIEETVGAMAELVKAGKVRALGLSEASPATLRRAHKVHPISALQSEYSLWSREPEADIIPTCRELGIAFIPYSPLGRGFLTGTFAKPTDLAPTDWRRNNPRFSTENFDKNLSLVAILQAIARDKSVTAAQLALAWILAKDPTLVPIPGARKIMHLEENVAATAITLTPADMARIEAAIPESAVAGHRYPVSGQRLLNG